MLRTERDLEIANANKNFKAALQLQNAGQYTEARVLYGAVLASGHSLDATLNNLGVMAFHDKDFDKAAALYRAAFALDPTMVSALSNLAAVYREQGRDQEAIEACQRVLVAEPSNAVALNNMAASLYSLSRYDEGMQAAMLAVNASPQYAEAMANIGQNLVGLNRLVEASQWFDRSLVAEPGNASCMLNAAICLLKGGDFTRGWPLYEARWHASAKGEARGFAEPLWLGHEPLGGKTILLHAEQGLGDTIQFARFVPMVAELGARVVLEVQGWVKPLFEQFPGVSMLIARNDPLLAFDYQCPLMSLPLALKTTVEAIPAPSRYLAANPDKSEALRANIGPRRRMRIGIAWNGRPEYSKDRDRSMPLHRFMRFDGLDVEVFSLQKVVRESDAAELAARGYPHFGDDLRDLGDTAALIDAMDLVIAVDTGVAHLAGAMGKPVWVLLSFCADWRWLVDRSDSPWYPSARLFRQKASGDWEGLFAEVRAELSSVINK